MDAAELRRAFDQSFAHAPIEPSADFEELLAIRVAGDPYAVRFRDVAGVCPMPNVLALPAETPGLLGIAGVRGAVVPVFGLAALLGHRHAPDAPKWTLLVGREEPLALAFHDLDGCVRVPRPSLHADARPARPHVAEVARLEAEVRAIISIPLVIAAIREQAALEWPAKER